MAFDMILGGALQGIGAGIVQQGQAQAASRLEGMRSRREEAMLRLRGQIDRDNNEHSSGLRQNEAKVNSELKSKETVQDYDLRDRNDSRSTQRNTTQQVTLKQLDFRQEQALTRLRSSLDAANDARSARLKTELEGGQIKETYEGSDGNIWVLRNNGTTSNTGVKFAPKVSASDTPLRLPGSPMAGPNAGSNVIKLGPNGEPL